MIVYFHADPSIIDQSLILRLENDIGSTIEVCTSWALLITRIGMISLLDMTPLLILVDAGALCDKEITINEIVGMISTMHRCISFSTKMHMAVVLSEPCNHTFIKAMQGTELMGVVPAVSRYGYEPAVVALRRLLQGHSHWPRDVAGSSVIEIKPTRAAGIHLTTRQNQVLSLVCNRGLSNKKIASALKISESTVKIHMSAILKEYGVRNRTQLALAASSSLKA
jgi:DNA-binding NarL/FixJ family response regulator